MNRGDRRNSFPTANVRTFDVLELNARALRTKTLEKARKGKIRLRSDAKTTIITTITTICCGLARPVFPALCGVPRVLYTHIT